ncbi:MAG: DUF423 domain-containing protein [Bacteroidetes bacterium]|nr:DUF423 domain-containing protein [Bacteroidota bacterium]
MQKRFLLFSGFSGAIGVALGAMAAHFLKSKLETGLITEANLQAFETAARYQLYHSLALFAIAIFVEKFNDKLIAKAGYCFMAGIVLFSGSLYLLTTAKLMGLGDMRWLGPITPIGGLFFITGWVLIAFAGMKKNK